MQMLTIATNYYLLLHYAQHYSKHLFAKQKHYPKLLLKHLLF
nr:MAG TPA: hypothetical protein [Crassvirales sp.]